MDDERPTREQLEEAIRHVRASQKRGPEAYRERYSQRIDQLLDQWVEAVLEESLLD